MINITEYKSSRIGIVIAITFNGGLLELTKYDSICVITKFNMLTVKAFLNSLVHIVERGCSE